MEMNTIVMTNSNYPREWEVLHKAYMNSSYHYLDTFLESILPSAVILTFTTGPSTLTIAFPDTQSMVAFTVRFR